VRFDVPNDRQDHAIVLTWDMFSGGHPNDRLDPHQLTGSFFFFDPLVPPNTTDGGGPNLGDASDAGEGGPPDAGPPDVGPPDAPDDMDAAADTPFDPDGGIPSDAGPPPRVIPYNVNIAIDSIRLVCY
jgi:hypothetical protein